MLPLSNVRVLDLADESGIFCTALLADLGARVDREGLLGDVDVVLTTGTPSVLAERGVDPAALVKQHPELIVAVISPFGLDGPRANWRACDTVAQALGGMMFVNGHPDEPPLIAMGAQAYYSAALQAAIGIVLALLARRQSGRGQIVDVSLLESTVAALEHVNALFHEHGEVARRRGTLHWTGAFRVVECRDGPVLLSHLGDWMALIEWVKSDGAAADLADPRWYDSGLRRAECVHVFDVLARWAARYTVAELVEQAQLRRLPFAAVLPLSEVINHPQLWARGFFVRDDSGSVSIANPLTRAFESAERNPSAERSPGLGAGWRAKRAAASGSALPVSSGGPAGRHPARRPGLRSSSALRSSSGRSSRGVLQGIRVLDFTWVVAGPVATRVLADHGADVIKVERVDAPDGPERRGGMFGNLNRGKRSLAVNLADARGVALVRDLARRCDVVIDNFSPRVMANWGLDHAALRAVEPRLVVLSLSGFGATGPLAAGVSYGPTLQAQSGFTWHMRHPGGAPAGWGYSYSDMVSGTCAALAVLAALWERERTGVGRALDLSQLELLATAIAPQLRAALSGSAVPEALADPASGAASGTYRCRDAAEGGERWCALSIADDVEWRRFAAVLGAPAWADDTRFRSQAGRLANAAELDGLIGAWMRTRSAATVMETLQRVGIAAGLVADARDLDGDPQLAARGYWVTLPGGARLDGIAVHLSATPGAVSEPGPHLGEHSAEVLRDLLCMEQSAIDSLRSDGVIR